MDRTLTPKNNITISAAFDSSRIDTTERLIQPDDEMAVREDLQGLPDPLDAPDYDPIDHLNVLFSHPSTLAAVSPVADSLETNLDLLDAEISELVITQAATNENSLARISAAKADLADLFQNIDSVRERALRTEEAITAMTADIKKLDSTKRNLTLSMTMLKRLQMLTTAFEQLKSNTKSRQYRECSGLLSAVLELMAHFKSYRSIAQIATLSRNVADVKAELLEQVCEDFEMAFVKGIVAERKTMLAEACHVIDALGDMAKQRVVNWYCNTQLREYRQVFRGEEAGSLDNISRRYSWLKRMLKLYDEEHAGIFPTSWKVNEVLSNIFCDGTKDDYKGILQKSMRKEGGKSLDVNLLLSALHETLEFEHFLERRFSSDAHQRVSIDTISSKDERPLVFGKSISEAFEPYLSLWVDAQDKTLSQMIPKYRNQPLRPPDSEDDFNPASSVLPSSIELFHFYRQIFAQCAKLSTGSKLLDLSKTFGKYLDEYADSVLMTYLTPLERASTLPIEEIATILNTADYCNTTTSQLEQKIRSRIDKPLDEKIDFERQSDAFLSVVSKVIAVLVRRTELALEPAWREMRNCPWARMESVGDQSGYVGVLNEKLQTEVTALLAVIGKDIWRRSICDRIVEAVVQGFVSSLVACKPISGVGAEQMLLDAYVIKKQLEELILLRKDPEAPQQSSGEDSIPTAPASYIKHVARTLTKLDALLKTLQVSITPQEGLVQAYLIHIADSSPGNFKKILDLKGIRKTEQAGFVDLFKVHVPAHSGLAESNSLMNNINLSTLGLPGGAGTQGQGAPGGSKGGFENLSAVLAAARDGVDRLQKEGGEQEGRLGRLFRRDGSGIRFGRDIT
ncbi:Vps53-like protein [Geopyxis carbonaria]|nr:Vps53-like protein [Geopyxis carbonaria]